jgi:predicted nucleic acid-binding protein
LRTYIDTSVLVAYYCPEPLSAMAEDAVRSAAPVISNLVETEVFSALSRKVRDRTMTRQDAQLIGHQFLAHLSEGFFERLAVQPSHFQRTQAWLATFDNNLRTLDGLHLAVAESAHSMLITADERLNEFALAQGIPSTLLTAD